MNVKLTSQSNEDLITTQFIYSGEIFTNYQNINIDLTEVEILQHNINKWTKSKF